MQIDEKKGNYKEFIEKEFTIASYVALTIFSKNIRRMKNFVEKEAELSLNLYKKKDVRNSRINFENAGFVQLDILCKIMMMIEGLCALMFALDEGRKTIPTVLSRYKFEEIDGIQKKFKGKYNPSKEDFMWKILSLPDIKKLTYLSKKERIFIRGALAETCKIWYEDLTYVMEFYSLHKIAYNKFKHGLSYIPYLPHKSRDIALSIALDRIDSQKLEPKWLRVKGFFVPEDYKWYNKIGLVQAGKKAIERYVKISEHIEEVSQFIIQNNLIYAENCGLDYLPMKVLEGNKEHEPWLYLQPRTSERVEKVKTIYAKAEPNINVSHTRISKFYPDFKDELFRVVESELNRIGIAVLLASEKNGAPPSIHKIEIE